MRKIVYVILSSVFLCTSCIKDDFEVVDSSERSSIIIEKRVLADPDVSDGKFYTILEDSTGIYFSSIDVDGSVNNLNSLLDVLPSNSSVEDLEGADLLRFEDRIFTVFVAEQEEQGVKSQRYKISSSNIGGGVNWDYEADFDLTYGGEYEHFLLTYQENILTLFCVKVKRGGENSLDFFRFNSDGELIDSKSEQGVDAEAVSAIRTHSGRIFIAFSALRDPYASFTLMEVDGNGEVQTIEYPSLKIFRMYNAFELPDNRVRFVGFGSEEIGLEDIENMILRLDQNNSLSDQKVVDGFYPYFAFERRNPETDKVQEMYLGTEGASEASSDVFPFYSFSSAHFAIWDPQGQGRESLRVFRSGIPTVPLAMVEIEDGNICVFCAKKSFSRFDDIQLLKIKPNGEYVDQ